MTHTHTCNQLVRLDGRTHFDVELGGWRSLDVEFDDRLLDRLIGVVAGEEQAQAVRDPGQLGGHL